jgi:hypothetical protein
VACRGVYFAITADEEERLLALVGENRELADATNALYTHEREAAGFQAYVDKAWDMMHRCLSGGELEDLGHGAAPRSWCVLGGRNLYEGTDYIICHLPCDKVPQVAASIAGIDEPWLRERYFALEHLERRISDW